MTGPHDPDHIPDELRNLDAALRSARFEPRASFGPELAWRMRHGEVPGAPPGHSAPGWVVAFAVAAALALTIASVAWIRHQRTYLTVDRCCFDLDGGRTGDDGVVVRRHRGDGLEQIIVYEDLDHSKSLTPADVIRFVRGPSPVVRDPAPARNFATTWHCCADYDGDGPSDDGLMVVGVPPDRVMMVALYERKDRIPPKDGLPLR
jgi:hypothetical protein